MGIIRPVKLFKLWTPISFQGWGKDRNYFEGWYFKLVTADQRLAVAFIPGISYDNEGKGHAFVQFFNGTEGYARYHSFDTKAFKPSAKGFELQLGDNYFSESKILIDLPNVKGEISFENVTAFPSQWNRPGIMGWYGLVPFMQCYHGLGSMNHLILGQLSIDGVNTSFEGGKGYLEKDWGSSFPKAYVWTQSNHFVTDDQVSVMASVAHIPWMGRFFIGFLAVLWWKGEWFLFTTYTGAKHEIYQDKEEVILIFKDKRHKLRIKGRAAPGVALISPLHGAMTGKVNESLGATLEVILYEEEKILLESMATTAGLELVGDVASLRG